MTLSIQQWFMDYVIIVTQQYIDISVQTIKTRVRMHIEVSYDIITEE